MLRNGLRGHWRLSCIALLALLLVIPFAEARADAAYEPVVAEFLGLMEARPDLRDSVEAAIAIADLKGAQDMDGFVAYLDALVTLVPTEREVVPECLKFYYIVNQAPGDALNEDEQFNAWLDERLGALERCEQTVCELVARAARGGSAASG